MSNKNFLIVSSVKKIIGKKSKIYMNHYLMEMNLSILKTVLQLLLYQV